MTEIEDILIVSLYYCTNCLVLEKVARIIEPISATIGQRWSSSCSCYQIITGQKLNQLLICSCVTVSLLIQTAQNVLAESRWATCINILD